MQEIGRLRRGLGAGDRLRLNSYLEDVREVERRIRKIEQYNASGEERAIPEAPLGVPDSFGEHVKLMFDLQALAFMANITRVSSFKMGRDASNRVFTGERHQPAVPLAVAPRAESRDDRRVRQAERVPREPRRAVPREAEEHARRRRLLLDHTLVIYGSPMGDSNIHEHKRCPLFLAGHMNGQLKGNLHLNYPAGTPMANVWLTLATSSGSRSRRSATAPASSRDSEETRPCLSPAPCAGSR